MSEYTTEDLGVPQSKLDDILRKVQGLISKAEHPNTGEAEADAFRAKAEQLMQRYRIEESELIRDGNAAQVKPILKTWGVCESRSAYVQALYSLMLYCSQHAGVRMTYSWGPDPDNDGKHSLLAKLVGYESDVRYAIMLYVTLHMTFSSKMEPKVDPNLSDADNIYNLRNAGVERSRISVMLGWGDRGPANAKVTRLYREACAARGEEPTLVGRGNSVKLYRKSYSEAFCTEIYHRLYRLRTQSGVDGGGALVLASRKENVDEEFYRQFPELRPSTSVATTSAKKSAAGRRRKYVEPKYSEIGLRAGRKAAEEADLTGRTGNTAPRKLT